MARNELDEEAVEQSSYTVTLSGWKDAVGAAVTPDALVWTLSTRAGVVINGRSAVPVTPAATVIILLAGDDLALMAGESNDRLATRILTIEGTYTSSLGSNVPLSDEYWFLLKPLVMVG